MRAVQLALLVMCIQFGLGFMAVFGGYGNIPYEKKIINMNITAGNVQSEAEQEQASINIMGSLWDILTWGWIRNFFVPWYYTDSGIKAIVDFIIRMLQFLSSVIVGVAFIEFVRNRINVLR